MLGLNLPYDDEGMQDSDELIESIVDAVNTQNPDEFMKMLVDSAFEKGESIPDLTPAGRMFRGLISLLKTIDELCDVMKNYYDDDNVIENTAEFLSMVEAGIKTFIATLDAEEE